MTTEIPTSPKFNTLLQCTVPRQYIYGFTILEMVTCTYHMTPACSCSVKCMKTPCYLAATFDNPPH